MHKADIYNVAVIDGVLEFRTEARMQDGEHVRIMIPGVAIIEGQVERWGEEWVMECELPDMPIDGATMEINYAAR